MDKIKTELDQQRKFNESVLKKKASDKIRIKEVDIRNYAKYIPHERSVWEKPGATEQPAKQTDFEGQENNPLDRLKS